MKNKKLNLQELKVKSFIVGVEQSDKQTVKGGWKDPLESADVCYSVNYGPISWCVC